jgi:hypothetical protein
MAQSSRLVRYGKVVSNLRYTDHQINLFVTAAGPCGAMAQTDFTAARKPVKSFVQRYSDVPSQAQFARLSYLHAHRHEVD